jgi:carbamoyl-phosphate synthase large subunit
VERSRGHLHGVIVQFGGQTPLKLAHPLEQAKVPILGTSPDMIDLAEDRDRFKKLLHKLDLRQPLSGIATTPQEARSIADAVGYPIVIRPSYVLGGRAMEIVLDAVQLDRYIARLAGDLGRPSELVVSEKRPLLIDRYLSDAIEVDVDCLADRKDTMIVGIMEHIEEAGIHSGDSACSLPPHSLSSAAIAELERQTRALALALEVGGLMNVQYAIKNGDIYVLEVNPRASRTVPFVAKVIGVPVAKIAARIMAGETLASFALKPARFDHIGVKEAVFPFARFPGVDTVLGPEMKSTGEVMGIDRNFAIAFAKSQIGGGSRLPREGTIFVSVKDSDKPRVIEAVRLLVALGFRIIATSGTQRYLAEQGVPASKINKVLEGRPHIVDAIKNGEVQLVFNTTEGATTALADSRSLRRAALLHKVPYYTTLSGAVAAAQGIKAYLGGDLEVRALQSYFGGKG